MSTHPPSLPRVTATADAYTLTPPMLQVIQWGLGMWGTAGQ